MELSHDLISQFAKLVTKDNKPTVDTTVYGTVIEDANGNKYVKLDGSDQLTPLSDDKRPSADSTTVKTDVGDRVAVSIKNHTATVTGNVSSPAAKNGDVENLGKQVSEVKEFDVVLAEQVQANAGYIKQLQTDKAEVGELRAAEAEIEKLETNKASISQLEAAEAEIENLKTTKIDADVADLKYAEIKDLNATNAKINALDAEHGSFETLVTNKFTAQDADIANLQTNSLTAEKADIAYAKIDFSNMIGVKINEAAIEHLFASSGMVKDITIDNGVITGELIGVTFKGDLVEAGTLKADRLVVKGENGIYYKLNIEGGAVASAEVTKEQLQNGLSGSVIIAKSITAEKVRVSDLVAFGATIGGFQITDDSIHSVTKPTVSATTRGFYVDNDGQFNVGDSTNFVKFFKDTDGTYKLRISADSVVLGSSKKNIEDAIDEVAESAKTNSEDLTKYIADTNKELENLQGQIDGSITTWFYEYVPTNTNIPASQWTTTDLKNIHLGDLFYDTITGYCYRWQVQNNQYSWVRISDVDVTKALADAAKAQTTADGKRRIFVSTPTTPYDVGDLWVQGTSGDIMRCQTAKTSSQSYAAADWVKASKYTDDTAANAAQADVNALKTRVTNAETSITQNKNAIELRATKTEVETAINNIEIGGTNLLINSSFKEDLDEWNQVFPSDDNSILNITKTASGRNAVTVVDTISTEQNSATAKLESANLLNLASALPISLETVTNDGDNLVFTNFGRDHYGCCWKNVPPLEVGKTYTFSIKSISYHDTNWGWRFKFADGTYSASSKSATISLTLSQEVTQILFYAAFGAMTTTQDITIEQPMINEGSTALTYTPYVDVGGVAVEACGRNLFNPQWLLDWGATKSGDYYTYKISASNRLPLTYKEYTRYTFEFKGYNATKTASTMCIYVSYTDGTSDYGAYLSKTSEMSCRFTTDNQKTVSRISVTYANPDTVYIKDVTLYEGSTYDPYEPYTGATYFADENGTVTITDPVSPFMTVMSKTAGVNVDLTYKLISGFVTKAGKPCLNIKHLSFGETKSLSQSLLGKLEPNKDYTVSCSVLLKNVENGPTNPSFSYQLSGAYDNSGVETYWGRGSRNFDELTEVSNDTWQRVVWSFNTDDMPELLRLSLFLYTRDMTGDLYLCDLKLEKGDKATDWSPAPEDAENDLADAVNDLRVEMARKEAYILEEADGITMSAINDYAKIAESQYYTKSEAATLKTEADKITASIKNVEQTIEDGEFTKVKITGKEFIMDENGFTVEDVNPNTNHKISTTVSNNGMAVKSDGTNVLTANDSGVDAVDLHARTYLIVGNNSRFEDYNGNRTACFWIGN